MIRKALRLFYDLMPDFLASKIKYRRYLKKNCTIGSNVEIVNCDLGNYVRIAQQASVRSCKIGDYSSIGRYSKINYSHIGKFCSISWDVTIGATNHPVNTISTHSFPYIKRIGFVSEDNRSLSETRLGNDVWVGCNSVILPGANIGDGAVIGAGSVVTKDIPDYAIVAGVPAKIIKYRFEEDIRTKLKEVEWWNFPYSALEENIELFQKPIDLTTIDKLIEIRKALDCKTVFK